MADLHPAQLKMLARTPDDEARTAADLSKGSGFATFAALNRLTQLERLGLVERIPTKAASLWRRTERGRAIAARQDDSTGLDQADGDHEAEAADGPRMAR